MNHSPKTILVVDDSESNTLLIQSLFEEKGCCSVDVIRKSTQVEKYLANNTPDIILLDLMMPQVSGFQILEKMKVHQDQKDIPVIVISAWDQQTNIDKVKKLGANEYVKKPINLENLFKLVESYLD